MRGEGKSMWGTWLVDESRIRPAAEREERDKKKILKERERASLNENKGGVAAISVVHIYMIETQSEHNEISMWSSTSA